MKEQTDPTMRPEKPLEEPVDPATCSHDWQVIPGTHKREYHCSDCFVDSYRMHCNYCGKTMVCID